MLYHASPLPGLKILKPHVSTHAAAYVYAIKNPVTAVCFGAPKDDFDLLMDESDGKTILYECYPDALKSVYLGKTCSLYTVREEGFLQGQTGWEAEMVSESAAEILQEEIIPDIHAYLLRAEKQGNCVIHRYSDDREYTAMLREELSERIRSFGLSKERLRHDRRFQRYLSKLLDL